MLELRRWSLCEIVCLHQHVNVNILSFMNDRAYYVYAHKTLSGDVFYIGKGKGRRAHLMVGRSEHWKRHVTKHGLSIVIVKQDMPEPCAFSLERVLIAKIGMKNLCNQTAGGEGTSGRIPSQEQRERCRMKNKGKRPSQSTIDAARKKARKPVGTVCGLRFQSITDAAKFIAGDGDFMAAKVSISACCRGRKVSQAYGYEFRFIVNGNLLESGFSKKERGKPVKNSQGMTFPNGARAVEWLRGNGFSKAISGNITQCCKGNVMSAYGYSWEYA